MPQTQYPVFVDGQTLTESELNDLRGFLHQRDRLVGRMVGFGVNAGLGGVVLSEPTLVIRPGLALDQTGEPLILTAEHTIALPPDTSPVSYDFIDDEPGGFSVVLESSDVIEPAPECGETGCMGHAELHTRTVSLRVVAGRVTGTWMDFAAEPLLNAEPIRLALNSRPTNSYTALRNAIADRLSNGTDPLVDPRLIAELQATSISSDDPAGIVGYSCGWLNMVLFATLDLLRVEALLGLEWDRQTTRPGVVLGWVHQVAGKWIFDCSYRHAWEPPRGFSEALLGGTCTDPAGTFRDGLEALLAGYAPPPADPVDDPKPPTGCPKGWIKYHGKCWPILYPADDFTLEWDKAWTENYGPLIGDPPPENWLHPEIIYGRPPIEVLGEKQFGLTDYIGHNGQTVKEVLTGFIGDHGAIPDVRVVPAGDAPDIEGYAPSGGFAPSDSVVLGVNTDGAIVSIGRVPTVQNVRTVGSALPAAIGAAQDAQKAATELRGLTGTLKSRLDTNEGAIDGLTTSFKALQGDFTDLTTSFKPDQMLTRVAKLESDIGQIDTIKAKLNILDGKVDVISKFDRQIPTKPGRGEVIVRPGQFDTGLAAGIADFAATTVEAMNALPAPDNRNFARYAAAAGHAQEQLHRLAAGEGGEAGVDQEALGEATLEVLSTLRTLVKASGAPEEIGRQLDAQLRGIRGLLP